MLVYQLGCNALTNIASLYMTITCAFTLFLAQARTRLRPHQIETDTTRLLALKCQVEVSFNSKVFDQVTTTSKKTGPNTNHAHKLCSPVTSRE